MRYNIQELRLKTGLSQAAFAKQYGIPVSTLRKWEQGETNIAPYVLNLIAETILSTRNDLIKIQSEDGKVYYYDESKSLLLDGLGNSINIKIDCGKISQNNLAIYVADLFNSIYDAKTNFVRDLEVDDKFKIDWMK